MRYSEYEEKKCPKCGSTYIFDPYGDGGVCQTCGSRLRKNPYMSKLELDEGQ